MYTAQPTRGQASAWGRHSLRERHPRRGSRGLSESQERARATLHLGRMREPFPDVPPALLRGPPFPVPAHPLHRGWLSCSKKQSNKGPCDVGWGRAAGMQQVGPAEVRTEGPIPKSHPRVRLVPLSGIAFIPPSGTVTRAGKDSTTAPPASSPPPVSLNLARSPAANNNRSAVRTPTCAGLHRAQL